MKKFEDKIFGSPLEEIVDFKFDEKVANVFEDMLNRSIPGYSVVISIIGMLTGKYAAAGTNCYDLGASLGAAALSMKKNIKIDNCKIIAVDNSASMINRAKEFIAMDKSPTPVELILADILDIPIENASVAALNYTLQFIPKNRRKELLEKIFDGMIEGGILILSEKIKFADSKLNDRQIERYHNFKRLHGYTDLEISRKRDALENVLIPETKEEHIERLKAVGFKQVDLWYQCFNFISLLAVK